MAEYCFQNRDCRLAGVVLSVACHRGHDDVLRSCERCASEVLRTNDRLSCPLCARDGHDQVPAGAAVYCGMCRRGAHGGCRSVQAAPRVLAGVAPLSAEGYCACTCDVGDELVPGAGLARQLSAEAVAALFAEWSGAEVAR